MKKKILFSTVFLSLFWGLSLLIFRAHADDAPTLVRLPTYYFYPEDDVNALSSLKTDDSITPEALHQWDQWIKETLTTQKVGYYKQLRFYTYLYAAQRDAAYLSEEAQNHFAGSLDPITVDIIRLFFPEAKLPKDLSFDEYSQTLADEVFPKYKKRFEEEEAQRKTYPSSSSNIQIVAKWTPWVIKPPNLFRPEPPPTNEKLWKKQLKQVKKAMKKVSPEQLKTIERWADPHEGDWRSIANTFMLDNDVPLGKVLLVRSVLMMGLYDATIANLDAKFAYHTKRPPLLDPSITPPIRTPDSPSYPSGHSTLAATASTILSYYFPEDAQRWEELADEAGKSRVWAGVHFPIDDEIGRKMGRLIGCEIVLCDDD